MLSKYAQVSRRNGIVALYHELHPDPVFCSEENWIKLLGGDTSGQESFDSALRDRKIIIHDAEVDVMEFNRAVENMNRKFDEPTILYLMTAQGCNFRCGYCPVPTTAKKYGESLLSIEDAFAGIDLWEKNVGNGKEGIEYFVIFYGGEPLLNKETISVSLDYIREKKSVGKLPRNLNLMIVTNGSLLDEEMIRLCQEHSVLVAVGLDGQKEENDSLKVDSNGEGTFDKVVSSIETLVKNNIRTFLSTTITPFNLDKIGEYTNFFTKLGVEKFGFNFMKGKLLVDLVGRDGLDDYYRKAARGVIKNFRNQKNASFEYQMEKKHIAFETASYFPVDCTCYGNQLVIQPDGQISNCPFFKAELGNVKTVDPEFRIGKQQIVAEWRKRLPIYHPGVAKAISGGGCAWSSMEIKNDPLAVDDSSRIFSEEVLDELIWSRYEQSRA